MRLIDTDTLEIEDYVDQVPCYVILSHTWGEDEVTFQAMKNKVAQNHAGYSKIKSFCQKAKKDGFKHAWIDTCCIEKTSSAELSEAINSMHRWYKGARICYAYLSDIPNNSETYAGFISTCKWFTRGWTLQELIAPEIVEFYAADWTEIGTKSSLWRKLHQITKVDSRVLLGADPSICNVAQRMSWAAKRQTSRVEDKAYCLMGLFDVNMPMLYGEGERAFKRLQEEILRSTEDYTIFAWNSDGRSPLPRGVLAHGPEEFEGCDGWVRSNGNDMKFSEYHPVTMTSRGLRLTLPIWREKGTVWAWLLCRSKHNEFVCIRLVDEPTESTPLSRNEPRALALKPELGRPLKMETIYLNPKDTQRSLMGSKVVSINIILKSHLEDDSFMITNTCTSEFEHSGVWMNLEPKTFWVASKLFVAGSLLLKCVTGEHFLLVMGLFGTSPWCKVWNIWEEPPVAEANLQALVGSVYFPLAASDETSEFWDSIVQGEVTDRHRVTLPSGLFVRVALRHTQPRMEDYNLALEVELGPNANMLA